MANVVDRKYGEAQDFQVLDGTRTVTAVYLWRLWNAPGKWMVVRVWREDDDWGREQITYNNREDALNRYLGLRRVYG